MVRYEVDEHSQWCAVVFGCDSEGETVGLHIVDEGGVETAARITIADFMRVSELILLDAAKAKDGACTKVG